MIKKERDGSLTTEEKKRNGSSWNDEQKNRIKTERVHLYSNTPPLPPIPLYYAYS